jgi:hypothetical protein
LPRLYAHDADISVETGAMMNPCIIRVCSTPEPVRVVPERTSKEPEWHGRGHEHCRTR